MAVYYTDRGNQGVQFANSSSRQDDGIGIVLPLGKSDDGIFFKQSFTTIQAAATNIKNLVLTMRGERIMHPTLGSGLWSVLMEPMVGTEFEEQIKNTIRENVKVWLPYIEISNLTVTTNNDNNSVGISMDISLKTDPQTKEKLYLNVSKGDI